MRPVFLEFCGINSFSEPAQIDFRSLLEYGIFGIFGDTGSGKSTILDCIGFALYGGVARSRSGSVADVINDRSDKAYVRFEFEIVYDGKRRRIRVERELKRKNAVQSVRVYEYNDKNAAVALSEGVRESNALLEKIIGLEQKDFEKCIALPQGEFAQFVKSSRSDRLKLISRLFDLENYGERLVKKANARCAAAAEALRLLQARLEPYADATERAVEERKTEIARLEQEEKERKQTLFSLREEEKRRAALFAKKLELEKIMRRISALEEQREEMRILGEELGRLDRAAEAVRVGREARRALQSHAESESGYTRAEECKARARQRIEAIAQWDASRADEEIARLTELCVRAEQEENNLRKKTETERALTKARAEYAAEAERFKEFSYERERQAIEERLSKLGDGDFFAFAGEQGKAALLREEYAVFAGELEDVRSRYREAEEGLIPLIEKYTALSAGEKIDFSSLGEKYREREKERSAWNAALVELEKKNGICRAHRERLQQLQTEGARLKRELAELSAAGEETEKLPRAEEAKRRLAEEKAKRARFAREKESAQREYADACAAFAAAEEKRAAARRLAKEAEARLSEVLSACGMRRPEEAEALIGKYGDAEQSAERLRRYREETAALCARREELKGEILPEETEQTLEALRAALAKRESEYEETVRKLALGREELRRMNEELERKRELEREGVRLGKQAETAERLKKLLEGNKFMDFVAEEYLQNVAANASGRLLTLTDGRYFLRYEGGASGFMVGDNFNGGKERGVYTLSGGETFLVSLSLALALSAEICAKSLRPIEFFFLDEGFGTLDERLVDTVMDSLERLRDENFSVGIITHVEELKHRIERRLFVRKANEEHGSRIYAE